MKVNLLILFIPLFSLSQVGVRNAFDNRGLSNYYFNITNNEKKILNNNPYFTPLYNGYRYNARLDMMNNSERTFADRDWFITMHKISKMEKLFPKVGKRVAQQFSQ